MLASPTEPPERRTSEHVYAASTRGLCATCRRTVEAKILFRDHAVYLAKYCPEHGHQECLIASSVDWYLDALGFQHPNLSPRRFTRTVGEGCPHSCGLCELHQQRILLPVLAITSACNLDCPICYTINRNQDPYQMSADELDGILSSLAADHDDLDIINFTGGEPTLHPELIDFLRRCKAAGVRRLTVSTNGLALADEANVRALAAADARVILSLDTLDDSVDRALMGAATVRRKLAALELLCRHEVNTTLLPAVAAGYNDRDLPGLLDLVITRRNIVSLEIHTMCFTGQGGTDFPRRARITIPDIHQIFERATGGRLASADFVPSPLAHSLCYSIAYLLLLPDGGWVPFTRFMSRAQLYDLLTDSLYLEPRDRLEEVFLGVIEELWADPDRVAESEVILQALKALITAMYPPDRPPLPLEARRRIAEQRVKAVYIHSHMDEENFDVSRVVRCCVGVPEPDGSFIPTCAYNVLYREHDPRFSSAAIRDRLTAARDRPRTDAAPGGENQA